MEPTWDRTGSFLIIQLHEFEALLFCGPEAIDDWMALFNQSGQIAALQGILAQFKTPEHIDKGPTTAPSKRLKDIYPSYDKVFVGSAASKSIGIDNMRQACRHFNEWLEKLLSL